MCILIMYIHTIYIINFIREIGTAEKKKRCSCDTRQVCVVRYIYRERGRERAHERERDVCICMYVRTPLLPTGSTDTLSSQSLRS